jgi:glycosyltransferase involved in cell wall biosynthesis
MKIAIWYNLPSGGAKRALYHQVQGLRQRGHELESWTLDTTDQSFLPLAELIPERVTPFHVNPAPRLLRSSGAVTELWHSRERLRTMHEVCAKVAEEVHRGDFDVLFASTCSFYAMPPIVRHVSIPSVVYLQEPVRYLYEAGGSYSPILPWIGAHEVNPPSTIRRLRGAVGSWIDLLGLRARGREEWFSARASSSLLVNSYYSREVVLRTYGRDADVCYLGIDTDLFHNQGKKRERFVVGLGSFNRIKGVDLAIESMARLAEPRPPLVWIANSGSDIYEREMREMAVQMGVDLQVLMRISDADLVDILNRAAAMVYTSRLEPFGLSPLEANACGTPVVAVREAGMRETIREGVNGFLADRDPVQLGAALERLLQDPILARGIGESAAAHIRSEWTWEKSIRCLEAHMHAVLSV